MPSPADRTDPVPDQTIASEKRSSAPSEPAELRTVSARSFATPESDAGEQQFAFTIPPTQVARGSPAASGSAPPSGQAIRDLNDWVDLNRDAIDLGDYKLLRSLGTGAFGTVWEAQHFETGEAVAIKFLSAGDDRWRVLLDEVKFMQALEGTHGIVTVKQVRRATAAQPPYYVMPLANGGSLAERLKALKMARTGKPDAGGQSVLPPAEAVRLITQVATALSAVHRRGIHHCDLKPRNILLHRSLPTDPIEKAEPLIADFGQAHLATDDTPALGTYFYMPPDQADAALRKARSDSSWDVYGLGAVLYEMIVGEPPRRSDSLLKSLRKTEHLETKLAEYRDGVNAAPKPTAHRQLIDPLLANIIDRCLDLDPARRLRDAGEVVDLLKHRAWWRQIRPLLVRGAVCTLLFLFVIVVGSVWGANRVYSEKKENASHEIGDSLARTAWYGKNALERTLKDHIAFAEQQADALPPDLRASLAATADRTAAVGTAEKIGDRARFDDRIVQIHDGSRARWSDGVARSVALILVAGDPGPARGFTIARTDGKRTPAADRDREDQKENYQREWSYRDYFCGLGNRFEELGQPHAVNRRTHISHTYRSLRDKTWRVDITTPVWSGVRRGEGKIVGLISIGLHVEGHLRTLIDMDEGFLQGPGAIARSVSAYVVNDRECWVWHEIGMEGLATDAKRDPDNLSELARDLAAARGGNPDDFVPWVSLKGGVGNYYDRYTDPVELKVKDTGGRKIAHTLPFFPYADSGYKDDVDDRGGAVKDRRWGFVVQVDEDTALRPLSDMWRDLFWAGTALLAALTALSVVLWVWLFRLLRGWEFAGHG